MPLFTKESLETLRQRVDLVEVMDGFMDLKKAGAAYKALCPFHDEKTPSFTIQKGDTHYHCYGCGAHGDAIAFLMNHQKMPFSDAVEYLGDKFQVHLEKTEIEEIKGPSKVEMRQALEFASKLYHTLLLHSEEGRDALRYLFRRDLTLDFIKHFEIGYAPKDPHILKPLLKAKGISLEIAQVCGLTNGQRDFFTDRIMFPIRASSGYVIGFSGRKYREETYGGKYVNTPETPLFKKSRVLFGLNYSRSRIAKDRCALIVEGQIDALRLIHHGLDFVVAGQGTAFGHEHVKELIGLGILTAYLCFDPDQAGIGAAAKVGDLFQKEGVEVKLVTLPKGYDPDLFIKEKGGEDFLKLLESPEDYLSFLVRYHSQTIDMNTPAGKNELANLLSRQIRSWEHPLMVHESLRKLAHLLQVPESMVGVGQLEISNYFLKKYDYAGHQQVDPDWVVETDVLRWLIKVIPSHPKVHPLSKKYLNVSSFRIPVCQTLFNYYNDTFDGLKPLDFLAVLSHLEEGEGQKLLEELTHKKIDIEKADNHFQDALQKLLDRNWMFEREKIRVKIQSGNQSDDEALLLAKQFEELKRSQPTINL